MPATKSKKKVYSVSPSALTYLFGDKMTDFFGGGSLLSASEKVPCRERKVKKNDLATAMLVIACAYLEAEGYIDLTVEKKGVIFKSDAVFASFSPDRPKGNLDGLERQIAYNITNEKKKDSIESIVMRIIGNSSYDPWGKIIKETRNYLLNQGYFAKEDRGGIAKIIGKKVVPQCEKISKLEADAEEARKMIVDFKASKPDVYKLLWKGVAGAIKARQTGNNDY